MSLPPISSAIPRGPVSITEPPVVPSLELESPALIVWEDPVIPLDEPEDPFAIPINVQDFV